MQGVSAQDYAGLAQLAGAQSPEMLERLLKALTAGNGIAATGAASGDGFALRVESLERTLKNLTFKGEHIRFWKALTKIPAYNTVEEHNQITSYGLGTESFVEEGALPSEEDSTYTRKYSVIKFMGTTRKVSHPMLMVKPAHGSVIANETVAGTMFLLKQVERALFEGNSALSALQFDGLKKLITDNSPATNIIDLRGRPMDEDVMTDGAGTILDAPNYGIATHIHFNPKVKQDVVKALFPKARYDLFQKKNGMIGLDADGFTSPAGDIKFEANTFITDGGSAPIAAGGVAATRPGAPTPASVTTPPAALSQFSAADAGNYSYYISAHNDSGNSVAVLVSASEAIAAGDEYTFSVTPAGGADTKWYHLYRTQAGVGAVPASTRLIARIPNTAGTGALTIHDYNDTLPFTTCAYMIQQDLECIAIKQLAPFLKIPLATVDANVRWMQLLYLCLTLYSPGKVVMFKNIGRARGYVGAS